MKSVDLFTLPSEIINNILLRLSVRSIAASKCVCKPLLHLLNTHDFAKSHFSKSAPALALAMLTKDSCRLKISELEEDEIDPESRDLLTKFNLFPGLNTNPSPDVSLGGSVNGLLFLFDFRKSFHYVCNPVTREFCFIRCPREMVVSHGFGVSRITGQHKLVCIDPYRRFNCYVYTLGTGSWRRVEANDSFGWTPKLVGTFLNGNLHWMVWSDSGGTTEQIFCFDLETECFSRFNVPPLRRNVMSRLLFTLRDCLCFCDDDEVDGGVVIWMMKEYGVEKSWTKEYVVTPNLAYLGNHGHGEDKLPFLLVLPIKVFKNGDVLMLFGAKMFMCHSKQTKTSREIGGFFGQEEEFDYLNALLFTPSLLPLKSFVGMENENVISF